MTYSVNVNSVINNCYGKFTNTELSTVKLAETLNIKIKAKRKVRKLNTEVNGT